MILSLIFLAGLLSGPPVIPVAHAQEVIEQFPVADYATTTEGLIARYSSLYGVSGASLTRVIQCESRGNERAWNKTDPAGGAKGIAQFLQPTFSTWSKRAGIENGDVWSKEDSIQTMAYMFSVGEAKQWSCWRQTR